MGRNTLYYDTVTVLPITSDYGLRFLAGAITVCYRTMSAGLGSASGSLAENDKELE